ncbi:MAG: MFS transporter [Bdellovibrionota bacterium]
MSPRKSNKRSGLRLVFLILWWEGAFAVAYETWIGPTYLSGLAGELGVPVAWVTVLAMIPWIGAFGQLIGAVMCGYFLSLRKYTLWVAAIARCLWVLPVLSAIVLGILQIKYGYIFPKKAWFLLLVAVGCTSALIANASSVAWMSWMKGLVPSGFQGRFFGGRQRYGMAALIVANLLGAIWVGWKPGGFFIGYGVVGVFAIASAFLSTYLLQKVPDLKSHCKTARVRKDLFRKPFSNPDFCRLLLFWAMFNGATSIAGPYFPYYFTKELGISMSAVAFWTMMANLGCLLASGYWGKYLDRFIEPSRAVWLVGSIIAVSPLPYVIPSASIIQMIAPVEFFFNGMAWAGFGLLMTKLIFNVCPKKENTAYFSLIAAANGLSGALCSMIGGNIAQWLTPWGGFRILWVIAAVARFGVLVVLVPIVFKPRAR